MWNDGNFDQGLSIYFVRGSDKMWWWFWPGGCGKIEYFIFNYFVWTVVRQHCRHLPPTHTAVFYMPCLPLLLSWKTLLFFSSQFPLQNFIMWIEVCYCVGCRSRGKLDGNYRMICGLRKGEWLNPCSFCVCTFIYTHT